jgi:hypothetical protein
MVKRAWYAYCESHFRLVGMEPTEPEYRGIEAALEAVIAHDDVALMRSRYPEEYCAWCGRRTNHGIYVPKREGDAS